MGIGLCLTCWRTPGRFAQAKEAAVANGDTRQVGVSPKLIADLVVSVVTFAVLAAGLELDEATSAAIAKVAGFIVGAIVGPGKVVVQ